MRRGWVALLGIGSVLAAGCAPARRPRVIAYDASQAPRAVQEGVASWYGPGFHGRKTSSREVYDQHDFTAAHRTLPLGTWALVTNTNNGQTVKVYVNDRGPYVDGRVIDLSYGAARAIGMLEEGTAPVRIVVLGTEPPSEPRTILLGER